LRDDEFMRTMLYIVPASMVLLVLGSPASTADDFKSNCTLPFDQIAVKPDPFITCGNAGSKQNGAPLSAAAARQANAKNNLCADASAPITVDFAILTEMQAQTPAKSTLSPQPGFAACVFHAQRNEDRRGRRGADTGVHTERSHVRL
jgi:hypothetical protein